MTKDIENIEEFEEEIKKMPPLSAKEPDELAAYIVEVLDAKKAHDIANLKALERSNLRAAIVGKALYDGRATFREMNLAAI